MEPFFIEVNGENFQCNCGCEAFSHEPDHVYSDLIICVDCGSTFQLAD